MRDVMNTLTYTQGGGGGGDEGVQIAPEELQTRDKNEDKRVLVQ